MYSIWNIIGAIFILLVVTVLVIWKFHKPYLLVGWFWYLGTLVPVIGLVQAGPQAMADRFTYIPLIGLFIIIAWGIPDILNGFHYKKAILSISSICMLSFLIISSCLQVRYWKNSITLFEHSLTVTTNNWLMHNNLGHSFILDGKIDDAILHFREALNIKPDYAQAQYNLGLALTYQGKMEESIIHYKKALKIKPDYEEAHTDLGSVLAQHGKTEEAFFHFREALRINPYFVRAQFNFGVALAEQGNFREAISHFKEALRIRPDYVKAHFPLGLAYVEIGDYRSALEEYKILKTINPGLAEILFNKIYENNV
jgi:Tfp pilus assembly protein PilF